MITKQEQDFVNTRGSRHAEKILNQKRCITITGPQGCGKKSIGHHLALTYSKEDYDVFLIEHVKEFFKCYNTDKKLLFLIDDPFGSPVLEESKLSEWCKRKHDILGCLQNNSTLKIIFTCRSAILQNRMCKSQFGFISENVLDIASPRHKLDKNEIDVFLKRFKCSRMTELSEIRKNPSLPLVCKLLKDNPTYLLPKGQYDSETLILDLTHSELNEMVVKHSNRYIILLLVLATNNAFNPKMHVPTLQQLVEKIAANFRVSIPPMNAFIQQLSFILGEMEGSFLSSENGTYKFFNEFLYNIVSLYAGMDCPRAVLEYCSCKFLCDHIHIHGCHHANSKHTIDLQESLLDRWVERILSEILKGNGYTVFFGKSFSCTTSIYHFVDKLKSRTKQEICEIFLAVANSEEICKTASLFSMSKHLYDVPPHIYFGVLALSSVQEVTVLHLSLVLGHYQMFDLGWRFLKSRRVLKSRDMTSMIRLSLIGGNVRIVSAIVKYAEAKNSNPLQHFVRIISKKVLHRHTNFPTLDEISSLCISSKCNHVELTKELISQGCNINQRDESKNTPLIHAAKYGYRRMSQLLLSNGADVNALNENNISALMYSVRKTTEFSVLGEVVDQRILFGSDIDGETVLMKACEVGNISIVQDVIHKCKSIDKEGINEYVNRRKISNGVTALFKACQCETENSLTIVTYLLKYSADPNISDNVHRSSPLHLATKKGDLGQVSILIRYGANVNALDRDSVSPLYIASELGSRDVADKLVVEGAEENANRDSDKMTPLLIASEKGHVDLVELLLLQQHIDVSLCNADKSSALLLATLNNHTDVCKLLVDKSDVNACNSRGYCPLLIAARNGNANLIKVYLENGAQINCASQFDGYTPLMMASMMGNDTAVRFLLAMGADTEIRDKRGYTARGYAGLLGHDEVSDILMTYLQYGPNCPLFQTPSVRSPKSHASQLSSFDTSSVPFERKTNTSISAVDTQESGRGRSHCSSLSSNMSEGEQDVIAFTNSKRLRRSSSFASSSVASFVYSDVNTDDGIDNASLRSENDLP